MNQLQKLSAWIKQHNTGIMWGLLFCIIVQQIVISSLQRDVRFLQEKYTVAPTNVATGDSIPSQIMVNQPQYEEEEQYEIPGQKIRGGDIAMFVISLLLVVGLLYLLLASRGALPFCVSIKGKIWQDLSGKVVFTLNIANRTRKSQNIDNAMISFIGKNSRRFRIPVNDLPLEMQPRTKHSVNVSLQRLFEQNQDLLGYKTIRAEVTANGKTIKSFPIFVKWQSR